MPNDVLAWTSKVNILGKKLRLRAFQKFSPKFGLPRVFTSREIHPSHFTAQALRRSLEHAGLAVVDESLDPYYAASGVKHVYTRLITSFIPFCLACLASIAITRSGW